MYEETCERPIPPGSPFARSTGPSKGLVSLGSCGRKQMSKTSTKPITATLTKAEPPSPAESADEPFPAPGSGGAGPSVPEGATVAGVVLATVVPSGRATLLPLRDGSPPPPGSVAEHA